VIALDTNLLVYAHRTEMKDHERAHAVMEQLFDGNMPWAIPVACIHEFMSVVTRLPKPSTAKRALEQVSEWLSCPVAQVLHSTAAHLQVLEKVILDGQAAGGQIHDARIVAICVENGVRELWTADRDFARFGMLPTRNPLR
jgi:uncharacterized protein